MKDKKLKAKKGSKEAELMRVEALAKALRESGEDVDADTIVSMYIPQRKAKSIGRSFLRLGKLKIILASLTVLIVVLFLLALMQEKMGNFTINLNRLELYRKGIAISADSKFSDPTARLTAQTVADATNITFTDIPENIDDYEGGHNGENYMAYTYYVRNAGKEDIGYKAVVTLDSCAKGAENAVRVAVWRNGERVIYAEPAADGGKEEGCESFVNHNTVCVYEEENFLVGNVDKYTIVIWMEGEDPECIDTIVGGSVQFSMNIDSITEEKTSLFAKLWRDIKEAVTGKDSINAAGNNAPDYYYEGNLTWENRRNK